MRHALWLIASVVLLGCASTVAGSGRDAAPGDATTSPDVRERPVDLCSAEGIIDVNTVGVTEGSLTLVHAARTQWTLGGTMPPSEGCGPRGDATHRLVLRYTPRSNAYLSVSVRSDQGMQGQPPPGEVIDRLVLLGGCAASATRIACAGRVDDGSSLARTARSLRTATTVAAGTPLYLVVGGTALDVTIAIRETTQVVPIGAPCDSLEVENRCVEGSSCVTSSGGLGTECRPDGSLATRCRRGTLPCDPGLACTLGPPEGYTGVCHPAAASGESCSYAVACVDSACVHIGSQHVCRPWGALLGRCRTTAPRCDTGLTCVEQLGNLRELCIPALASGSLCATGPNEPVCPSGESCVRVGEASRCTRDGSAGGRCRTARSSCDDGLVCVDATTAETRNTCVRPTGVGAACDPTNAASCGAGASCVAAGDGAGRCVALGEAGARCRGGAVPCADGLRCAAEQTCVSLARPGETCSSSDSSRTQCVPGASCVPVMTGSPAAQCRVDGTRGAPCRWTTPRCDDGLVCGAQGTCVAPVTPVPLGAQCDPSGAPCAGGARCEQTCRADGAESGWCRSSGAPCDETLACVVPSNLARPFCVRPLSLGAMCEPLANRCAPGLVCRWQQEGARCEQDVVPTLACAAGGPVSCGAGTRCEAGLCRHIVNDGAACDLHAVCSVGTSCLASDPNEGWRRFCLRDGSLGGNCRAGASPCDEGLACGTFEGTSRCLRFVGTGVACTTTRSFVRCASNLACRESVCVAAGAPGMSCRDEQPPCGAGLFCNPDRVCVAALPLGAACTTGVPCEAPGVCYGGPGGEPRCDASPYSVAVRSGVAFEDPCATPLTPLSAPLSLRILGADFSAAVDADGSYTLRSSASPLTVTAYGQSITLSGAGPSNACGRVVGEAPRRRVLFGGGRWSNAISSESEPRPWAVIFTEGTNTVEFRYTTLTSAQTLERPRDTPSLATGSARLQTYEVPTAAGTSVVLTPR